MKMTESQKVAAAAWRIRRYALQMGEVQGQGYIGQALGYADVLATAFSHAMTYRPEDPEWEGRDRFLLSHGHYAIAYYAALLEAGIIPEAELETYGSDDSRLPMSGMALGLRQKQSKAWVYNSMSDGELDEGSTWEAAMSAAHYGLSNLINLVDVNKQQADGDSRKILGFEPLQDKWAAFGWYVQRVDGNDLPAVMAAFDNAKSYSGNQPRVILCDTLMGKGVPFLETRDKNHFIRVDADEWQKAIAVLDANKPEGVL
ncbi:TPA: transketolase [Klebsiella pneumoniae]|uniref:transketolase n=1 Tax=Klebsiella pneumoniae TaxID=573 RepID=UPI0035235161